MRESNEPLRRSDKTSRRKWPMTPLREMFDHLLLSPSRSAKQLPVFLQHLHFREQGPVPVASFLVRESEPARGARVVEHIFGLRLCT